MRYLKMTILTALILALTVPAFGRNALKDTRPVPEPTAAATAVYCNTSHNVGRIALGISNDGTIGRYYSISSSDDYFTGEERPSCDYPKGSGTIYLFGAGLWIGAATDTDTLVSTAFDGWAVAGNEWHPDDRPMQYRSILRPDLPGYDEARSEQDYIAWYYDTCRTCVGLSPDEVDGRAHVPLNLEVTQQSYAWSYSYADDFVLIRYAIKNIGTSAKHDVYLGMAVDGDVMDAANTSGESGYNDDFAGFVGAAGNPMSPAACPMSMDLNLGWIADNDGDMNQTVFKQVRNITGIRMLGYSTDELKVSYNWWVSNALTSYDYGPMRRSNFRDFGTGGTGTAPGDRNKYFYLSNGDVDFDEPRIGTIGDMDPIWMPPSAQIRELGEVGSDAKYCLSWGPFDIAPGETVPLTIAYVGGMEFHKSADNLSNLPYDPDAWYEGVNFDSFVTNAIWAEWVYDNPGFDSDSDGYKGEFEVCGDDTIWVKGDGIPDFRAGAAPHYPKLWVEPIADGIQLRWNGFRSETDVDPFSHTQDFEGYRAYLSTGVPGDWVLTGSYDIEDYYRYCWDSEAHDWALTPEVFTYEEAVCYHAPDGCGDSSWDPLYYTREHLYVMPGTDSVFYFEQLGPNAHVFELETPFVKPYPDAPKPPYAHVWEVPDDEQALYLTDDGYFKYYEYIFTIKGLVPGVTYWAAVTAYDNGSGIVGSSLESPQRDNDASAVPVENFDGCCLGTVGNVDCSYFEEPTLGDIYRLIDFMFVSELPLCCVAEADIDGSGGDNPTVDDITLGDLGMMIRYMFLSHADYPDCR